MRWVQVSMSCANGITVYRFVLETQSKKILLILHTPANIPVESYITRQNAPYISGSRKVG